jgi:excisionase family DNA binding protein
VGNSEISLLTVRQVAERLGVTEAAIRRWLLERRIASVKIGRRLIRIPSSEINRIVDTGFRPVRPTR